MGEKIKTLGSVDLLNQAFEVELNAPPSIGMNRQIHIQSDKFRFEMDEDEFIQLCTAVNLAAEKLKHAKGLH